MAKVGGTTAVPKNAEVKRKPSELGRKLRRLSDEIAASGEKLLTRRELERELAQRRGGIR